ncbi:MAG: epoxyqueuosine reductase, partial [Croceibacterium sp.]
MDTDELKQRLIDKARELGFVAVGFAPAEDNPLRARRLQEWLAAGFHGEMDWMEARADVRKGPQAMWPEARSVIALGMSYVPEADPLALADNPEKARISVYAQGRDYHDTVKKALKALARWLVEQSPEESLKVF